MTDERGIRGDTRQSAQIDNRDPIVRRLRRLTQESPDLTNAARFYGAILPLLSNADLGAVPTSLTSGQTRAKMESGLPLLSDLDLELDDQAAGSLMLRLALAIETIAEDPTPTDAATSAENSREDNMFLPTAAARHIRQALEDGDICFSALLPHIAAGNNDPVVSLAASLQLDPVLLRTLAEHALRPALREWRRQLTPLAEGIPWHRGYCFICGAEATLGELRENGQARHLRCGQCGADWAVRRLQCTYCGNEDHRKLGVLYEESRRETMRVEVCNCCRGYLKVITAFLPTSPELLPVEDLATLHLDYIAQERGYRRNRGRTG